MIDFPKNGPIATWCTPLESACQGEDDNAGRVWIIDRSPIFLLISSKKCPDRGAPLEEEIRVWIIDRLLPIGFGAKK